MADDEQPTPASLRAAARMRARAEAAAAAEAGGRPVKHRRALEAEDRPAPASQRSTATEDRDLRMERRAAAADSVEGIGEPVPVEARSEATGRSRNTAIFSILTLFSRVAGLLREILAKSFFGTTGPASAFTLAFQIPNLLRSLFADSALSAAFLPAFTDLLQQGRRKDALKLAVELAWVILLSLSAIVAASILLCPLIVPLLMNNATSANQTLAVHLTQIMFPVVALLGLNGLLVGILNAEDHFTIPALSPVVWNVLIIVFMVGAHMAFDDQSQQLYGYAIGVLIGTIAQLTMAIPLVRRAGFRLGRPQFNWRSPQVREILVLMIPVSIGLGLVNFNVLINTVLGYKISQGTPVGIDAAFRLYMLPQGIFSVAIATVLFPALSRAAARLDFDDLRSIIGDGMRQILILLVPAAALSIALAAPVVRLVYEHGEFNASSTAITVSALWVFSLTLPLNGINLLLTRSFFALKQPWTTTKLAALSLLVNLIVSVILWKPLGVGGIIAGTVVANIAVVSAQLYVLHGELGGSLELMRTIRTGVRVLIAACIVAGFALVAYGVIHSVVGSSTAGLALNLMISLTLAAVVYVLALRALRVEEAISLERTIRARFAR